MKLIMLFLLIANGKGKEGNKEKAANKKISRKIQLKVTNTKFLRMEKKSSGHTFTFMLLGLVKILKVPKKKAFNNSLWDDAFLIKYI